MSRVKNNVKKCREERMMSKTELARRALLSVLTIDRVERGENCRPKTKRQILKALGFEISDRHLVFPDPQPSPEQESETESDSGLSPQFA
jgi:ribosome-binding protein aMBF1 (putative translation factor)